MKKLLQKIASLLMALAVLLSTMSFTIEKHYCGDFLVDVSVFGDVEKCNMESNSSKSVTMKNCCKDEIQYIEGQDKLQKENISSLSFEQQKLFVAFLISYQCIYLDYKSEQSFCNNFSPPDLDRDIQALYQTFLI